MLLRDSLAVALNRPADCTCFGLGAEWAFRSNGWPEWCPCPAGQKAQAAKKAADQKHWQKAAATHWRAAQIPTRYQECRLDTYPVSASTAPTLERVRDWREWGPLTQGTDDEHSPALYLFGATGVGKTGLAVGVFHEMIHDLEWVPEALFINFPALLAARKAEFGQREITTAAEAWEQALTVEVLIVDDIGAEYDTAWTLEQAYTLVHARHSERRETIYTSNLTPAELADALGERVAWRIVEMSHVEHVVGPNLRDRKARAQPDVLAAAEAVAAGAAAKSKGA